MKSGGVGVRRGAGDERCGVMAEVPTVRVSASAISGRQQPTPPRPGLDMILLIIGSDRFDQAIETITPGGSHRSSDKKISRHDHLDHTSEMISLTRCAGGYDWQRPARFGQDGGSPMAQEAHA